MTRRLFRRAASLRSPPRETRWYTAGVAQLALLVVARQYVARAIALSGGESHWRQAGITAARLTFDALVFLCATDVDYRRSAVHFASPTGLLLSFPTSDDWPRPLFLSGFLSSAFSSGRLHSAPLSSSNCVAMDAGAAASQSIYDPAAQKNSVIRPHPGSRDESEKRTVCSLPSLDPPHFSPD